MPDSKLYYGDNLEILRNREYFPNECVDLIYLDPPFNSSRSYNVLFKDESGLESEAQITAFDDTWHWGQTAEAAYYDLVTNAPAGVAAAIGALRTIVGTNQMMAYLVMMTARLVELHRVLKPTGSLYLHCDPTASHYLKVILDTIFGAQNFQNEIIWKRTTAHSDTKQGNVLHMGRIHDVILFYTKTDNATRNEVYAPYDDEYVQNFYKYVEPETGRLYRLSDMTGPGGAAKGNPYYEVMGVSRYWRYSQEKMEEYIKEGRVVQTKPGNVPQFKRYLDEMSGVPLQDLWDDIQPVQAQAAERLGYPTQKPEALLERIISASSNP
ncbi:MAG: site-specific DNA-methyltransferase, partial [Anaerolineae bacterium]|nr:site-specific DNA-methyltransferase [Anaerolineae bacterium]